MSSLEQAFSVSGLPVAELDNGTSVLITGDDTEALRTLFARVVAPRNEEAGLVLDTEGDARSLRRSLDSVVSGAGDASTVLTTDVSVSGDDVGIDDLSDVTTIGMSLSNLTAEIQQETDRFRTGVFLCTGICTEVDDMRSVYRFLNTNFLSSLRRNDAIGVCVVDTSADIGTETSSLVAGLDTSFSARIDIESVDSREATLSLSGFNDADGEATVSL
ncbi:uncharacterized protein NP_1848A [Natronomonas pharaonis DSM 2160]|uniref:FtsZ family protein, noncanonical n=1 Tax=Natronomonas pharaonis (strain ATCC 35678 / DSM 2160 / CIP 103997 / JCM 8858 / NBRC 14720 / NCIMB 2260 / Gabara) TaxID=348780 RepID=A0A1U7EVG6_NATPD|nr:hypothetical protein [Natronomonas pharaonis]CAI49015.1 uncharacterized protein NP_1848A [Natronomonas pharaonis DSM 2160]